MKKILFFLAFSSSIISHGMEITEPYNPPLSVSHPKTAKIGVPLALIAGTYALEALCHYATQNENLATLFTGCRLLTASFAAYNYYNNYNTDHELSALDSLLIDPEKILKINYKVNKEFEDKKNALAMHNDLEEYIGELDKLSARLEEKAPLFFAEECGWERTCEGPDIFGGTCIFTRAVFPYRSWFEDYVGKKILHQLSLHKQQAPFIVTSFGSGGLFAELVILTKILAKNPHAQLDIHLIDKGNIHYNGPAHFLKRSNAINLDRSTLDFEGKFDEFIEINKAKMPKTDSETALKKLMTYKHWHCLKSKQVIIKWLQKTFPKAKINLFLHTDVDNYLEYLKYNNLNHADIIFSCDIQDPGSLSQHSVADYKKLCTTTLKNKPTSHNFWLAENKQMRFQVDTRFILPNGDEEKLSSMNIYLVLLSVLYSKLSKSIS